MPDAASNLLDTAGDVAANVKSGLRNAGVDTDVMARKARDQATDLQRMVVDEIARRPWHALGAALLVGYWLARR